MGVFPAASSSHVPKPWAQLMSDPVSLFTFTNFTFIIKQQIMIIGITNY